MAAAIPEAVEAVTEVSANAAGGASEGATGATEGAAGGKPATARGRTTVKRPTVKRAAPKREPARAQAAGQKKQGSQQKAKRKPAQQLRQYGGKRAKKFALGRIEGPTSGALFAEYFGGALVIILTIFTEGAGSGYATVMTKVIMRLSALTAVFFVLFLMTGSKNAGKAAIWLGLLIDLGIIFTAARGQTLSTAASEISGQGVPGIQADAVTTALTVPSESTSGVQLPDE